MRRRSAVVLVLVVGLAGCGAARPVAGPTAVPSPDPTSPSSATEPAIPSRTTLASPAPTRRPTSSPTRAQPTAAPHGTAPTPSAPDLPGALRGTDWTHIPTTDPVVALTFDAGGDAAGVAAIVATLERTGTPATFFLTGSWIRGHPAQTRRLAGLDARLGNHTDTHPHVPTLTNAQIAGQLEAAEQALVAATDRRFDPLVRFPFGDTTRADIRVVNELGYVSVRWTVDTLGWQGTSSGGTAQRVVDRVVRAAAPGAIVLMHVGGHPTDRSTLDADALPAIVRELRDRGYRFVTLQALLDTA